MKGRPGYEHLNEPLHILIEADLPANIVDMRLRQAQEIIEELLKPVVNFFIPSIHLLSTLDCLRGLLIYFTLFFKTGIKILIEGCINIFKSLKIPKQM